MAIEGGRTQLSTTSRVLRFSFFISQPPLRQVSVIGLNFKEVGDNARSTQEDFRIPGHVVEQDGLGTWPSLPLITALSVGMNLLTHWAHFFSINPGLSPLLYRSICFPVVPSSKWSRYSSHNLLFGLSFSFRTVIYFSPLTISLGTIRMKELFAVMEITHQYAGPRKLYNLLNSRRLQIFEIF